MSQHLKSGIIFSVLLSSFSLYANPALAAPIQNPVLSGTAQGYDVSSTDPTKLVPVSITDLSALLAGTASSPGGNVELGKLGSTPATTLSGTINGKQLTLSSLILSDWTANSYELTDAFIKDAASTVGFNPDATQLSTIRTAFIGGDFWQRVSDPNISYIESGASSVKIGLAGFYNATPVLKLLFDSFLPSPIPNNLLLQVSEVVKVTYGDIVDRYYYSFTATPSGLATADGSQTGNYEIHVPEPTTWLLMLSGLFALTGIRVLRTRPL